MPIWFIAALVVFGIALLTAAWSLFAEDRGLVLSSAGALAVLGLLCTLFASANTVPVRNVGIVTSFNKPTGETTGSGLHWVAPWKKIRDWDASIQTDDSKTQVRISTGAVATVQNKVRWQVKPEAAPRQFTDYKGDFKNMKANLFEIEKQAAFNEAFADYNPIANVDKVTGQSKYDLGSLADEVKSILERKLGSDFTIHSVVIPLIEHDKATQGAIEQFQQVVTQGRTLEQQNKNADTQLAIAAKLKNLPEGYTVNRCLDIAEKLGREPGFCLGGGNPVQAK